MGKTKDKNSEKKREKKAKKKRHKEKKLKRIGKKKKKSKHPEVNAVTAAEVSQEKKSDNYNIPIDLMVSLSHAPETPDAYQKKQKQIRRVTDPTTGRIRLIKGDGEVLEEIVSRDRQKKINKLATETDGTFFQEKTVKTDYKYKH